MLDAVSRLNEVRGVRGLGRFFKQVCQSARQGSQDDFLGSINIPISVSSFFDRTVSPEIDKLNYVNRKFHRLAWKDGSSLKAAVIVAVFKDEYDSSYGYPRETTMVSRKTTSSWRFGSLSAFTLSSWYTS